MSIFDRNTAQSISDCVSCNFSENILKFEKSLPKPCRLTIEVVYWSSDNIKLIEHYSINTNDRNTELRVLSQLRNMALEARNVVLCNLI